jgi:hypothetical protein
MNGVGHRRTRVGLLAMSDGRCRGNVRRCRGRRGCERVVWVVDFASADCRRPVSKEQHPLDLEKLGAVCVGGGL